MRVPLQWLADYVDVDLPIDELSRRLTMANLKVEGIEQIGGDWNDVVVGEVLHCEPHPTSRKPLLVTRVTVGDREETIVTGASNVTVGQKVPVVPVGGLIPHGPDDRPLLIEPRPMAGITSRGMLASARELGISDEHEGILILPSNAPVGVGLRSVLGDVIVDLETQPNRPDTLSMIGIAREVSALTEQQITLPDLDHISGDVEWLPEESIAIQVDDPDLCPRYSALRIEGIRVSTSPFWLKQRLELSGVRSINLVVDITNYVMLEYGQPLHSFDAQQLQGDRIVVRRARDGEHMRTLDGTDRTLGPDMLVIADGDRAVAIAGVMGGENSEITDSTTTLVLESATFDPVSVRGTAKTLGLRTEASSRFEKGLAPETTVLAMRRFLQLLARLSEGPLRVCAISDAWVGPEAARVVTLPLGEIKRLVGVEVPGEQVLEALSLFGFDVTLHENSVRVVVPYWRRTDIAIAEDLVEEVMRIVGYDTIPATLPAHTVPPPASSPALFWEDVLRQRLLAMGVSETITKTFTSDGDARRLGANPNGGEPDSSAIWEALVVNAAGVHAHEALIEPMCLQNPPSADRRILPLTLMPSLLDVVARNLKHTDEGVAFFEAGRTFFRHPEGLPYERRTLTIALSGQRRPPSWQQNRPGTFSFYDVKGMLIALLEAMHITGWTVEPGSHPALHPGRAAVVRLRGADVAVLGEVHPTVAKRYEIETYLVQVAEIDLDALLACASPSGAFRPLPRHPSSRRDLAVVVPVDVPAASVEKTVRAAGGEMLERTRIFDVYVGEPLPAASKSLALDLEFRAPGATLRQEDVTELVERIVTALHDEIGASLRS